MQATMVLARGEEGSIYSRTGRWRKSLDAKGLVGFVEHRQKACPVTSKPGVTGSLKGGSDQGFGASEWESRVKDV